MGNAQASTTSRRNSDRSSNAPTSENAASEDAASRRDTDSEHYPRNYTPDYPTSPDYAAIARRREAEGSAGAHTPSQSSEPSSSDDILRYGEEDLAQALREELSDEEFEENPDDPCLEIRREHRTLERQVERLRHHVRGAQRVIATLNFQIWEWSEDSRRLQFELDEANIDFANLQNRYDIRIPAMQRLIDGSNEFIGRLEFEHQRDAAEIARLVGEVRRLQDTIDWFGYSETESDSEEDADSVLSIRSNKSRQSGVPNDSSHSSERQRAPSNSSRESQHSSYQSPPRPAAASTRGRSGVRRVVAVVPSPPPRRMNTRSQVANRDIRRTPPPPLFSPQRSPAGQQTSAQRITNSGPARRGNASKRSGRGNAIRGAGVQRPGRKWRGRS